MNLPELQRISEDELRKIYPTKYYGKYARHVNVLQYESQVLREDHDDRLDKIIQKGRQSRQQIPEVPQKRQYNPRYDNFQTIIQQNKYEAIRMARFSKALSLKLETTPEKKTNMIRSPAKDKNQVDQNVLNRLKAIEDMEYEKILKDREKRKKYLQQKSLCKFVKRSKSNQNSPRHLHVQYCGTESSDAFKNNPEYKTINSLIYSKSSSKLVPIQSSKDLASGMKSSRSLIKKLENKSMLKRKGIQANQSNNLNARRDLIQQTRKIRVQVESMETFSFYDALLLKRKRQQILKLL